MDRQPPLVQAITSALLVAAMLTAVHFFSGTRPGDPLVYAFIVVVAITGFILTFIRARAIKDPARYEGQGKFLQTNSFLALTFVALLAYGTAFSALFTLEPGESLSHGLGLALAPSIVILILLYRKAHRIVKPFWQTFALVITVAVASAGVTWALEKFV